MTGGYGSNPTFFSTPGHNSSIGSYTSLQDLVPSQQMTAVGIEELLNAVYQVALQLVYIGQMLVFHSLLTFRTGLPSRFAGLITSYMNVFGREKFHDFRQYILQKGESFFITDTEIGVLVRFSRTG